jgi:hypothetical protein
VTGDPIFKRASGRAWITSEELGCGPLNQPCPRGLIPGTGNPWLCGLSQVTQNLALLLLLLQRGAIVKSWRPNIKGESSVILAGPPLLPCSDPLTNLIMKTLVSLWPCSVTKTGWPSSEQTLGTMFQQSGSREGGGWVGPLGLG